MKSNPPRNLQAALYYAQIGWAVIPVHTVLGPTCSCQDENCQSPGKHPIATLTPKGLYDASTEEAVIRSWFTTHSWANIAIVTGEPSGLVVLDIDPRNGGDESLQDLLATYGDLPETVTAATGGGGTHYYFQRPALESVPKGKVAAGIDLQADGAYVLAPYSGHASQRYYEWRSPPDINGGFVLPEPPGWVFADHSIDDDEAPPGSLNGPYPEGARNSRLASDAGAMVRRGYSYEAVLSALHDQNAKRCDPPLAPAEVTAIAKSICRYDPAETLGPGEVAPPKRYNTNPYTDAIIDLKRIMDPDVGRVDYVVDHLIPRANFTMIAADWKTGKTLITYRLLLDLIFGRPGLHKLAITRPYRVAIFQLEMPPEEDLRRLRRLTIGMGLDPRLTYEKQQAGALTVISQPGITLGNPEGRAFFHSAIDSIDPEIILVDSLLAGFAPADANNNSAVREILGETFIPLTKRGVTCIGLHHFRKASQQKGSGSPTSQAKAQVIGAQQFAAASGRIYSLERLENDNEENPFDFHVKLSSLGSWTPTETDFTISISDMWFEGLGEGTDVRVLSPGEQIEHGGVDLSQAAGLKLAELIQKHPSGISQITAFKMIADAHNISPKSLKKGLTFALKQGWLRQTPCSTGIGYDLNPGDLP